MTRQQLLNLIATIENYAIPSGKIHLNDYAAVQDAVFAGKRMAASMQENSLLIVEEAQNHAPKLRHIDEAKPKEETKQV